MSGIQIWILWLIFNTTLGILFVYLMCQFFSYLINKKGLEEEEEITLQKDTYRSI